jgi:uncharacterized protein
VTTLERLLADPKRGADAVPYRELCGFLFAVLNGPELIPPSEWIPEIFGGVQPEYASPEQARSVMAELMALHNEVVALLATDPPGLPVGVVFTEPPLANFDDDAPLASWARGFTGGYQWIEESWDGVEEEFGSVLAVLGFFSSRSFATEVFEAPASRLGEMAATTLGIFAEAAVEYQQIGRSVADAMAEPPTAPATSATVPRNEPCPCGSGRTFKTCCGASSTPH